MTKQELINQLERRVEVCNNNLEIHHNGQSTDDTDEYWEGALTSACVALQLAKKLD